MKSQITITFPNFETLQDIEILCIWWVSSVISVNCKSMCRLNTYCHSSNFPQSEGWFQILQSLIAWILPTNWWFHSTSHLYSQGFPKEKRWISHVNIVNFFLCQSTTSNSPYSYVPKMNDFNSTTCCITRLMESPWIASCAWLWLIFVGNPKRREVWHSIKVTALHRRYIDDTFFPEIIIKILCTYSAYFTKYTVTNMLPWNTDKNVKSTTYVLETNEPQKAHYKDIYRKNTCSGAYFN